MNRSRLSSLVVALALAAGGAIGTTTALGQVGTSVTYQGQLKNNGVAVNSPADVRFSIWDAATLGNQIGATDTKIGVAVSQGLFSTTFDCGVNPYTADAARWLQIEVRNPSNVGGFVLLGSRQRLTPAPFSAATRGINVDSAGKVGIGTPTPAYPLDIVNDTPAIQVGDSLGTQGALYFGNPNHGVKRVYTPGNSGNDVGLYTSAADVYLSANGTSNSQFVLKNSGNVGIGTPTPAAKLNIMSAFDTTTDAFRISSDNLGDPQGYTLGLRPYVVGGGNVGYAFRVKNNAQVDNVMNITRDGVGIGTTTPDQLLTVNGNASKPGGGSWAALCDERSKNDIEPMTGTLDRLLKLKGHSYSYKPEYVQSGRALPGTQVGLVAQEVETVFPAWVSTSKDGLKVVTERSTTALMVEALRDLRHEKDAEIARVKADNDSLKARLEKIEALLAAQPPQAANAGNTK